MRWEKGRREGRGFGSFLATMLLSTGRCGGLARSVAAMVMGWAFYVCRDNGLSLTLFLPGCACMAQLQLFLRERIEEGGKSMDRQNMAWPWLGRLESSDR